VTAAVDAHDLVSAARDLVRSDDPATATWWPRAAALLGRQGLELAMDQLWQTTAPGLEQVRSMRVPLLCVGPLLNDRALGGRVNAAWHVLSNGCHHRVYDLPLTATELNVALETVWELAEAVAVLRRRAGR